jgi:hypothetical protein
LITSTGDTRVGTLKVELIRIAHSVNSSNIIAMPTGAGSDGLAKARRDRYRR